MKVFCTRLIEIGPLLGKNTSFLWEPLHASLPCTRPVESTLGYAVRPGDEERLRGLVVEAVEMRVRQEKARAQCLGELGRWLREGKANGVF